MVSKLDTYMFDLNGYLLVEKALSAAEVKELNEGLEAIPTLEPGEWYGYIQFRVQNGTFMCGQINVLIALNDIGPGDGTTMVIPGSHKSSFPHPQFAEHVISEGASVEGTAGAVEVFMKAGDTRNFLRWSYRPSPELLARLTPVRRQIVWPWQEWPRVLNRKPGFKG